MKYARSLISASEGSAIVAGLVAALPLRGGGFFFDVVLTGADFVVELARFWEDRRWTSATG